MTNQQRVRTPIDAFLLEQLETEGLSFLPDASKRTLMRCAWLDLIGLPPSPEEIRAYMADNKPGAYERLIDELLASPPYGERWSRHWLDVVGYTDVSGFDHSVEATIVVDGMWRYRDWVIRASNEDMPCDQFLVEQLAGDELVGWASAERYTPVMVNRVWQHHFGRGIVENQDDFGMQGNPPTHPKLLDWLAVECMHQDWSIKNAP